MRILSFALILLFPVNTLAADFASQAKQRGELKIGEKQIDQDMRAFFQTLQEDQPKAVQQKIKKYKLDGSAEQTLHPLASRLQDKDAPNQIWGQRLSDEFRIEQANARRSFCNGVDLAAFSDDKCLYTGEKMQEISDLEAQGRRKEGANDDPRNLVWNANITSGENKYLDNITSMSKEHTKGKVEIQPWSSDYWALATGTTAKRYNNDMYEAVASSMKWDEINNYFDSNDISDLANRYITDGTDIDGFVDSLSPAEKYDLLVGDVNWNLTKNQINQGRSYYERYGKVETWMGICHGWAPAAYMDPRPRKSVKAVDPKGGIITFYPDDIKALSTLKWANGITVECKGDAKCTHKAQNLRQASRFIGGRCNAKDTEDGIATDPETGAVIDSDCFDSNPGAWHKTIVNQIGVMKSSFVIDVTFDYEVWNQPVVSYEYTYFDPATQEEADFKDAIKPTGFKGDKFAKHRQDNPEAEWVIGIIMDVVYEVETSPVARETDDESNDKLTRVRYTYDLELDSEGKIIGGEWYNNTHPDFIWTPSQNAFAWNNVDHLDNGIRYTPSEEEAIDPYLTELATSGKGSKKGIVLKAVLDGLLGR